MKVLTYLGFTVLSIVIQFCVMDYIHEQLQSKNNKIGEVNITKKKKTNDLISNITDKPHALYYRTLRSKSKPNSNINSLTEEKYSNTSLISTHLGITDIVFEVLYDENMSTTTDFTPTTENFATEPEFDNVTEITFFEVKNKTSDVPKKYFNNYCDCNLLFEVCDLHCCCDQDCTGNELRQFQCKDKTEANQNNDRCISYLFNGEQTYGTGALDNWFCVVKTNLPDKKTVQKPYRVQAEHYIKWKHLPQHEKLYKFKKTILKQDDPIALLRNGTIYYFDIPTTMVNNYCTDRTPIKYLREQKIRCIVKFSDLEMFHIRSIEESMVVSTTESTANRTALNCTNLHCINWTMLACEDGICKNYNKSIHSVSCTETTCLNVAHRIDYVFYSYDFKITNATIKLHIQRTPYPVLPFLNQEITVKFIMTNKSENNVIELSGNLGYIHNLPVIISYAPSNYSQNYFNNTTRQHYFELPENQYGMCVLSNMSEYVIRFGVNKRLKCRYVHTDVIRTHNYSSACEGIQQNINRMLGLKRNISIAPYGNPYDIKDMDWIKLDFSSYKHESVSGEYDQHSSKLYCFNLIDRISVMYMFAKVNERDLNNQNKILSVKYEVAPMNTSFTLDDISLVLTSDINFVDVTKPNLYVYASSPHLNIHLPKDFFFPFPPNNYCPPVSNSQIVTILSFVIYILCK